MYVGYYHIFKGITIITVKYVFYPVSKVTPTRLNLSHYYYSYYITMIGENNFFVKLLHYISPPLQIVNHHIKP